MKTTNKKNAWPVAIKSIVLAMAGAGLVSLPYMAYANPTGGQVIAGNVTIRQESATKIGITQTSAKGIIDWQKYNIGTNEQVQYYQPSASSVTLNRVVGQDPSQILGRLTANGQIFLVNPNGIFFGKNAQVDVAGLVASTHNIRNEDFLAGRYNFNIPGKPGAAVINEGTIRIADTGIASFVAPSVANRGVIVAKLGKVALAAANGFTLDFHGDELLSFLVSDEVAKTAFDLEGNQLTSFVENSGKIQASGGYVLLTAKGAENAIHNVINQSGIIEATSVGQHKGEIILSGGQHGVVSNSGKLDASGKDAGETGGKVQITGQSIDLKAGSLVDASGDQGGGSVLIGGDYLGGNASAEQLAATGMVLENTSVPTAKNVFVNRDVQINADAVSNGNGGKVVLWADDQLTFDGLISAKGGQYSGDGGKVETSGKRELLISGIVDASAKQGQSGLWFMDPTNVVIANSGGTISAQQISQALSSGTSVTISSANCAALTCTINAGSGFGSIQVLSDIIKSAGGAATLNLQTNDGSIIVNRGARIYSTSGKLNVNINARKDASNPSYGLVAIGNDQNYAISTNGGDVDIEGLIQTYQGLAINTNGGAFRARTTPVASPFPPDSRGFIGIGPTPINQSNKYTIDTGTGKISIRATGGTITLDNHALATGDTATLTGNKVLAQPNILSFNMADEVFRQNIETGLGGGAGYGSNFPGNDDNSTSVNISTLSGNSGLTVLGKEFDKYLYLSNNGYMRLDVGDGSYTPYPLTNTSNPIVAAFFGDVDTRGGIGNVYYGTLATNTNNKAVLTWVNSGYYSYGRDKRNTFQLQLENLGQEINMRMSYDQLQWTTGSASGGSGGLYGTVARAGFAITGINNQVVKFELPSSGNQEAMLALDDLPGNTGYLGRWSFRLWATATPPSKSDGRYDVAASNLIVNNDVGQAVFSHGIEKGAYPSGVSSVGRSSNAAGTEKGDYRRAVDYSNRLDSLFASKNGVMADKSGYVPGYAAPTDIYKFTHEQTEKLINLQTLPEFRHALGPEGLVIEKLTETERLKLVSLLISNGIPVSFDQFGDVGQELKQKSLEHQQKWSKLMQDSLDKVAALEGMSAYDYTELAAYTGVNLFAGVADAISLGVATGGTKIPTTVAKLKKWNGFKSVSSYPRSIGNLQEVLDSPLTKIFSLVVQNGFTVTDEVLGMINNDKSLGDQLKNSGVLITDLAVGKKISGSNMSLITGLASGKLAQALSAVAGDLLSNQITGDKTEIMNLLSTASEFFPIVGPIVSQYKKSVEISSRISPEAKLAWNDYLKVQQQYRVETDKLNKELRDKRLGIILNSPYQ